MSHRHQMIALLLALTCWACEPLEQGSPPTFAGNFTASALSPTQASLVWSPGSDDLNAADELRYGVWFLAGNATIDPAKAPDILTQEGALSYNLTELETETTYTILIRARDRGGQYSDNTATKTVTTNQEDQGLFLPSVTKDLSIKPSGLIGGVVFNGARDDIGLINDREIIWYKGETDGSLTEVQQRTSADRSILDAFLIDVIDGTNFQDLLILTDNRLLLFENEGNGFDNGTTAINEAPQRNTLFFSEREESLKELCFFVDSTQARIYSHDGSGAFTRERDPNLGDTNAVFNLMALDDDEFPDMVSFGRTGLRVALGVDDDYNFDPFKAEDDLARDIELHQIFFGDGDGDSLQDVFIFLRDESQHETKLLIFKNRGDGTLADRVETSYQGAFFKNPRLYDINNDNSEDWVFSQARANNAVVYLGPSTSFNQATGHYGGTGLMEYAFAGDFDGKGNFDLVLISTEDKKMTLMVSRPTTKR